LATSEALLGEKTLEPKAIMAALIAIAKIGDSKGVPALRSILEQKERFGPYLNHALAACAALPDPTLIPHLQQLAADRTLDPQIRCNALESLLFNTPTQSEKLFISLSQDASDNDMVRDLAIGALASVPGNNSKQVLQELASDLSNPFCTRALTTLTKGGAQLKERKERFIRKVEGE
jgi:HEAT repeat protein